MLRVGPLSRPHPAPLLCAALLTPLLACGCAAAGLDDDLDEAARLADAMALAPGAKVADVGAGDGDWSELLVEHVGATGHVYATEVDEDNLDEMRERFREVENLSVLAGDAVGTGLPDACCDAILLRMVYHHFTDPPAMRGDLLRALRPGGRLMVVDIEPQEHWRELDDVPDRGGHGIPAERLIEELSEDGFRVLERFAHWNDEEDRYAVVFQAPGKVCESCE